MSAIFAIRAEPGLSATLAAGRALGLAITPAPLFTIAPVAWQPPAAVGFDALLIGSANAIRHGGKALQRYKSLPVHAVGARTAEAAREAGLAVASEGSCGLQALLDTMPPGTRLLRLGGEERVVLDPPAGVTLAEHAIYRAQAKAMDAALADRFQQGGVVLLHSAAAARHFAAECARLILDRSRLALALIGPRLQPDTGTGWRETAIAPQPTDAALLAAAAKLWQKAHIDETAAE
ncbi:MAG: uroporphyrinogen-III synthase [Parerythrobacter sp.]